MVSVSVSQRNMVSHSIEVFPRPLILHRDMSLTETGTDWACDKQEGVRVRGNLVLKCSYGNLFIAKFWAHFVTLLILWARIILNFEFELQFLRLLSVFLWHCIVTLPSCCGNTNRKTEHIERWKGEELMYIDFDNSTFGLIIAVKETNQIRTVSIPCNYLLKELYISIVTD